jgi:hypothetical protein
VCSFAYCHVGFIQFHARASAVTQPQSRAQLSSVDDVVSVVWPAARAAAAAAGVGRPGRRGEPAAAAADLPPPAPTLVGRHDGGGPDRTGEGPDGALALATRQGAGRRAPPPKATARWTGLVPFLRAVALCCRCRCRCCHQSTTTTTTTTLSLSPGRRGRPCLGGASERPSGRAGSDDEIFSWPRAFVGGGKATAGGPAIYDRVVVVAVACVRARARLPAGRASCGRGGGEFRRRRRRAGARDPPERDVSEKRPRGIAFASTGTFSPLYCHWRCPAGPGRAGPRDAIALPAS